MSKSVQFLAAICMLAVGVCFAGSQANASVCFLPDGGCNLGGGDGMGGDTLGGVTCSGSTEKPTPKECYDCDSCVNDAGQTLYNNCHIKDGYEVVNGQCQRVGACPTGYKPRSELNCGAHVKKERHKTATNCYKCGGCEDGYELIDGECKKKCPTDYERNKTCTEGTEVTLYAENDNSCIKCVNDECPNGAKNLSCDPGFEKKPNGKYSNYSQSPCYVCEKEGCDENAGYFDDEQECNMHYNYSEDGHCHKVTVNGNNCWFLLQCDRGEYPNQNECERGQECDYYDLQGDVCQCVENDRTGCWYPKYQCNISKGEYSSQFECEDLECQGKQNCHCTQDNETGCWIRPVVNVVLHFYSSSGLCQDWGIVCGEKCYLHDYTIWMETEGGSAPEEITAEIVFAPNSSPNVTLPISNCSGQNKEIKIAKGGTKSEKVVFQGDCAELEDDHGTSGAWGYAYYYDCVIQPEDIKFNFGGPCYYCGGEGEEFEHNGIIYNLKVDK